MTAFFFSRNLFNPGYMVMKVSNWRRLIKNTMQGLFDLELDSGMRLHDCILHQKGDARWIAFPARPALTKDGTVLKSPKDGKPVYSTCVDIPDHKRREAFQKLALETIDRLLRREAGA
jgi:hypothetical protein